jgi:hypothetical protein
MIISPYAYLILVQSCSWEVLLITNQGKLQVISNMYKFHKFHVVSTIALLLSLKTEVCILGELVQTFIIEVN